MIYKEVLHKLDTLNRMILDKRDNKSYLQCLGSSWHIISSQQKNYIVKACFVCTKITRKKQQRHTDL